MFVLFFSLLDFKDFFSAVQHWQMVPTFQYQKGDTLARPADIPTSCLQLKMESNRVFYCLVFEKKRWLNTDHSNNYLIQHRNVGSCALPHM